MSTATVSDVKPNARMPKGVERNRLQWRFEELPKEERRKLTAAYKAERQNNPRLDWYAWLSREFAVG
jgi:hypothetical protein